MRSRQRIVCFVTLWLSGLSPVLSAAEFLTGSAFQKAIDGKAGRAWTGVTVREAIRELSEQTQIAIVLDRRIDPTQELNLSVPLVPLRELLDRLASAVNGQATSVGSVVFLGPAKSSAMLRTLVEVRRDELRKLTDVSSAKAKNPQRPKPGRAAQLTQAQTFAWDDFARPRDVLRQIGTKYQLEIEGIESIPHDLWAAATLPKATAIEALSLILIQFQASFEFSPDLTAVRIVPVSDAMEWDRTYTLAAATDRTLKSLREKFPQRDFRVAGTKLSVRATADEHSRIEEMLKTPTSGSTSEKPPPRNTGTTPSKLSSRIYKMVTFTNTPLADVIKALEGNGIKFTLDRVALGMAEISLDEKIDYSGQQVSAEKMIRDIFEPHGLEVLINGEAVTLKPKAKSP